MLLLGALCIVQLSCKGPQGEVGPAGAAGPAGATGPAGVSGVTGNANVIQFTYAPRSFSNTAGLITTLSLPNTTTQVAASSAFFVYLGFVNGANPINWHAIPGNIPDGGSFRTWLYNATTPQVAIQRETLAATTGSILFTPRVVMIPANDLRNGRKAALDFTSYNEVKAFYNLPD